MNTHYHFDSKTIKKFEDIKFCKINYKYNLVNGVKVITDSTGYEIMEIHDYVELPIYIKKNVALCQDEEKLNIYNYYGHCSLIVIYDTDVMEIFKNHLQKIKSI
jgi:hypothetical protein